MTVMSQAVGMMLEHFGRVVVVSAEGNHDISGSIWLRKYIKHVFGDDERVEVIDNEFPFYVYLWEKRCLAFIAVTKLSWLISINYSLNLDLERCGAPRPDLHPCRALPS